MKRQYFLNVFTIISVLVLSDCERRVSQEEWHRYQFGGMAVQSEPNQWTMAVPNNLQESDAQVNEAGNSQIETNIQTVEVGRDKLVLVNDQGSIKMVKASQLPTVNKQPATQAPTTEQPNTVIQMPLDQYYAKEASNPTRNPNEMMYQVQMNQNYAQGNRMPGLPVAYAHGSKNGDRPNYVFQSENPCKVGTDNPPIYIPAPQVVNNQDNSRNTGDNRKMVRIIIEMPESMTRNIDEASRYAATQVKRLRVNEETDPSPKKKIRKNVEVIRKIVQMEEDKDDRHLDNDHNDPDLEDDMEDEATNHKEERNVIIAKNGEKSEESADKKYIIIRKSGSRGRRPPGSLKQIDKYKKVIKVYRN